MNQITLYVFFAVTAGSYEYGGMYWNVDINMVTGCKKLRQLPVYDEPS